MKIHTGEIADNPSDQALAARLDERCESCHGRYRTALRILGGVCGQIYVLVVDEGPLHQSDIGRRIGKYKQSTQSALGRLVNLGLIECYAHGNMLFYRVKSEPTR